jgi:beta-N-acetylhexosaminidase
MFSNLIATICLASLGLTSVRDMTLEEKVGQLLMVHFNGEIANEDAKALVQETKVGGIIYYNWSNGLHSPQQVQVLSSGLQRLTEKNPHPIPLLIAVDQEGGRVARLKEGFTQFPGNKTIGETGNPQLAKDVAFTIGQELVAVGVNMNLAPVVDVNSNPSNPVIGTRSFSDQAETVVAFGEKALLGYREAHVIATLKHYPGYGDVTVDPHADLPVVHKTKEELERVELVPFAKLAPFADAIMTAHILVPAFDPENCSTLSEKTLKYLRETIGFQGVIVSDSLVMEGVLKKCGSVDEAAIQALNAGCDVLILGGKLLVGNRSNELTVSDVQRIHGAIIKAVEIGRISEARVDEAVGKILKMKGPL